MSDALITFQIGATMNDRPSRVLVVTTSHDDLGGRRRTGAYAPEVAIPWVAFTEAGLAVDLASVAGGRPPFDGLDTADPDQQAFFAGADLDAAPALAEVDLARYGAVFFAGGHGIIRDFTSPVVGAAASAVWAAGGLVASVCHGPAALVGAVDTSGQPLVRGRAVTGFSNAEERAARVDDVVPVLLADRLAELGADYREAPAFTEQVVVDGRLITGQNPAIDRTCRG